MDTQRHAPCSRRISMRKDVVEAPTTSKLILRKAEAFLNDAPGRQRRSTRQGGRDTQPVQANRPCNPGSGQPHHRRRGHRGSRRLATANNRPNRTAEQKAEVKPPAPCSTATGRLPHRGIPEQNHPAGVQRHRRIRHGAMPPTHPRSHATAGPTAGQCRKVCEKPASGGTQAPPPTATVATQQGSGQHTAA